MKMHCENHCTWRGDEDELIPDPDQTDRHFIEHGTRYVCPVCHTNGALVEDWDTETEGATDMKKQHREIIDTLDRIISIPLPASGAQSTTVRGLAAYAADMRELVPRAQRLIWILRQGENVGGEARYAIDAANRAVDERLALIQKESEKP